MRNLISHVSSAYKGLPSAAWRLAFAAAINRSGTMVLPFLAMYLTEKRGYTPFEAGRLQSIYGIAAIAGTWLGGALSDRIGAKRVQISSLVSTSVFFLVFSQLTSTWAIALTLFVLGVSNESLRPANLTAVSLIANEEVRTRCLALLRLAVNFGVTFGWLIGGSLAEYGFKPLFFVDAATCLIAMMVIRTLEIPHEPRPKGQRPRWLSLHPFRDRWFVAASLLFVVLAIVLFQMDSSLPIYMRSEYGVSKRGFATLIAINTILVSTLEMSLVKRLEKERPLPLVGIGGLLLCVGLGILPFGRSYGYAAFAIVILTFGEMLWAPFMTSFVAHRSPPQLRGQYMGVYSQLIALAQAFAPAIGTALYTFHPELPWWTCLALGPVLLVGFKAIGTRVASEPAPI